MLEGGEVGCLASSEADELVEESERYEMEEEALTFLIISSQLRRPYLDQFRTDSLRL